MRKKSLPKEWKMKKLEVILKNLNNNLKWKLKNQTEKLMEDFGYGMATITKEIENNGSKLQSNLKM